MAREHEQRVHANLECVYGVSDIYPLFLQHIKRSALLHVAFNCVLYLFILFAIFLYLFCTLLQNS